VAVWVTPPADAEIFTEVELLTLLVETVKVALWAPAGTVTLVGTVATALLLLDNVTTVPPGGATSSSVTVPCEVLPPWTEVGFSANRPMVTGPDGAALLNVTVPWEVVPPYTEVGFSVTDNGPGVGEGSTQSVAV
jgi:hypothetical protein